MESSDTVLMELPAGFRSSWDGHDTPRCGSSRVQLSVCIKGTQKRKVCRPSKAISTIARSTSLPQGGLTATNVCLCTQSGWGGTDALHPSESTQIGTSRQSEDRRPSSLYHPTHLAV